LLLSSFVQVKGAAETKEMPQPWQVLRPRGEAAFMAKSTKAKTASAVSKHGLVPGLDDVRKRELKELMQIEQDSFKTRQRYWERTYLQAVYDLWCSWPKGKKWSFARQSAGLCGIQVQRSHHGFRILIDCTSPQTGEKIKSRWTQALRYAYVQRVEPSGMVEFFGGEGKGGVAGRAQAFAAHVKKIEAIKQKLRKLQQKRRLQMNSK
jgi:hypothetical protein